MTIHLARVAPEVLANFQMPQEPDLALIETVMALSNADENGVPEAYVRERGRNLSASEVLGMKAAGVSLGLRTPSDLEDEIVINDVQELSESEVKELVAARKTSPAGSIPVPSLESLKLKHHNLARLLATGLSPSEVAPIVGMSVDQISNVQRSPAFKNLIIGYSKKIEAEAVDLGIDIRLAAASAVAKVKDYVSQPLANLDPEILKEMTFGLLDRAGHSPVAKSVGITAAVTPSDINRLKASAQPGQYEVIDASVVEPVDSQPAQVVDAQPANGK